MKCVQLPPGSRPRISSSAMPTSRKPGPIRSRIGTFSVARPAIAAVKKIGPESTRKRTPTSIADRPRPVCM